MKIKFLSLIGFLFFACAPQLETPKDPALPEPVPKSLPEKRETREERFKRIQAESEERCERAKRGLSKHGGQILFNNVGDKCYMMTALQIFLHSKPIFEAFCKLDASKLSIKNEVAESYLYSPLTANLYLLWQEAFDPDRDVSKVFESEDLVRFIVGTIPPPDKGKEWLTCGYMDSKTFLTTLLGTLAKEVAGASAADSFSINYKDASPTVVAYGAQGGDSIVERLEKHFKRLPVDPPPKVIFLGAPTMPDPTRGLAEKISIPGVGDYLFTGAALNKGKHFTARIKNLNTGKWQKLNSLGSSVTDLEFNNVINDIKDKDTATTLISFEKAE